MNIYSIYIKDQNQNDNPIVIKQGFSFLAAIFNGFWALYHKMWRFAIFALAFDIIPIIFMDHHLYDEMSLISRIGLGLIFGFMSADMREYNAKAKGYELEDVVVAASEEEAELKFLARTAQV